MPTPRVTIDELPEQETPADSDLVIVHAAGVTKKMTVDTFKTVSQSQVDLHIADPSGAHAASAISADPHSGIAATDVQGQLEELSTAILNAAFLDVRDFGAIGDGVADDTAAIQAAFNAATATGGVVWAGPGTYILSSPVTCKPNVTLKGAGQGATIFKHKAGITGTYLFLVPNSTPGAAFEDLTIDLNKANTTDPASVDTGMAIYYAPTTTGTVRATVNRVEIKDGHQVGLRFIGQNGITDPANLADMEVVVTNSRVTGCKYGLYAQNMTKLVVKDSVFSDNSSDGITVSLSRDTTIDACVCEDNTAGYGIVVQYQDGGSITNCTARRNGSRGIAYGGGSAPLTVNKLFRIANNLCTHNAVGGITLDPTIDGSTVAEIQDAVVSGNVCSNSTANHGIYLQNVDRAVIVGNVCNNNPNSGILVHGVRCVISDNLCTGNNHGLFLAATAGASPIRGLHTVGPNHLDGNTTARITRDPFLVPGVEPDVRSIVTHSGTATTAAVTDAGCHLRFTGTNPTYTIPTNATVAFPVGAQIGGVGTVTAMTVIAASGVTVNKPYTLTTTGADAGWTAVKVAADEWDVRGDFVNLTGTALWFDASDTATITASSGAVSQWNDRSGGNRHVTQATAGAKPTTGTATINGQNVLVFDGGDYLNYAGTTGVNVGAVTVFAVAKETLETAFAGILSGHHTSGSDNDQVNVFTVGVGDGTRVMSIDRNSATAGVMAAGVTPLAVYVARLSSSGLLEPWSNGVAGTTNTLTGSFGVAAGGWLIGGRYQSATIPAPYRLNGQIAELVVYPTTLSNVDINPVGRYLAAKWGISWTNI